MERYDGKAEETKNRATASSSKAGDRSPRASATTSTSWQESLGVRTLALELAQRPVGVGQGSLGKVVAVW